MRLSLVLPAGLLVVAGAARSQETPPPDPLETGAWMKVLGLASGAPDPVTLSEAEVNLLLGSAQLSSFFERQAGLSGLTAQLSADQVRLGGEMDGALLAGVLGPLAPPEGGPAAAVRCGDRTAGRGGLGPGRRSSGERSPVFEAPPQLLNDAALSVLVDAFRDSGAAAGTPVRPDVPFPLPGGIEAVEVRDGEIRLTPAPR